MARFFVALYALIFTLLTVAPASADDANATAQQTSALLILVNAAPDVKTKVRLLNVYADSLREQALAANATPLVRHLALAGDVLLQQKALDDQQAAHDAAAKDVLTQTQCRQSTRLQGALTGAAASVVGDFLKRSVLIGALILPFVAFPHCDQPISQQVPPAPTDAQKAIVKSESDAILTQLKFDQQQLK